MKHRIKLEINKLEEGKRKQKGRRRITKGKKRRRVRLGSKREGAESIGGGLTSCSKDNWFETLLHSKSEYFSPRMSTFFPKWTLSLQK